MIKTSGLVTDFYELTMIQGYYLKNLDVPCVFDMFFRRQPFDGGYSVFAGLEPVLQRIEGLGFSEEDIGYLESTGLFRDNFLAYLKDFRFHGDIYALPEGSIVFPNEPLVRVHGNLIEAQLIESMLLNILNFSTLIATKTARIYTASGEGKLLEFGLRRAQGLDGALTAARSAYIGGAAATSNTEAAKILGFPAKGTMAHSWIMAFPDEETAFREFAGLYPDDAILLIDTYGTLQSGIENAVLIGKELQKRGKSIGVRLDSGDLNYLSKEVRRRLDEAGLTDAVIAVSNELDEEIIRQLVIDGSPIDIWGVGTNMVTGGHDASLTGVYKLASKTIGNKQIPVMKISNNPGKTTNPGVKQIYRFFDSAGRPIADLMKFTHEDPPDGTPVTFHHPTIEGGEFTLSDYADVRPLLVKQMRDGKRFGETPALSDIRKRTLANLSTLDTSYKRIVNPHIYKVSLSEAMKKVKIKLINHAHF